MDHAEVMALMTDAVAAPGGLPTLVADPSPDAAAVREHVRACADCAAEWRAWSVVSLGLAAAAPDELAMRPAARDQILGSILARPRPMAATAMPMPVRCPSAPLPAMAASATRHRAEHDGAPASRPSVVPGGRTGRTRACPRRPLGRLVGSPERAATGRGSGGWRWLPLRLCCCSWQARRSGDRSVWVAASPRGPVTCRVSWA